MYIAILKWAAIVMAAIAAATILAGQVGLFEGTTPDDLGVHEGRLKPLSATENSVTSQAALYPAHPQHQYAQIAPIELRGDGPQTLSRIREVVEAMPGAKVVVGKPDYLYVQFRSRMLKFVDDVEFWYDPGSDVVHLRSASRVGRKDFGVNRARIEAIRTALNSN